MKVGIGLERIAGWSHLPAIPEYDHNSILLVFGICRNSTIVKFRLNGSKYRAGLAWFAKIRDDRLIYGLPLPKTHSPRQRYLD